MNKEQDKEKSWWTRYGKVFIVGFAIASVSGIIFFSSGMDRVAAELAQAYAETDLYENALEKANADQKVNQVLGELESIDKLAILEGEVSYSNGNQTVNSTIRIRGTKGKAKMDISADRVHNTWNYRKINVRYRDPLERNQEIRILSPEIKEEQ